MRLRVATALLASAFLLGCGRAATEGTASSPMQGVAFEQRLDAQLPADARLADESGRPVVLGALLGGRPAVLAFVYYRCPMLCPMLEEGLVRGLRGVALDPGTDYETVLVSIDPDEGPDVAAAAKARCVRSFARPGTEGGWHFLTGDADTVRRLADAAGFRYRRDAATKQFAHAAGVLVITPDARVARYLFGIDFAATDLRLALVEASARRIAGPVDAILLFCLCWDPTTGRYGPAVMNLLRLGGGATVVGLGALVLVLSHKNRRASALAEASA